MTGIEWGAIVAIAFMGSLGHCVGMCGGFVIAYASAKIDPGQPKTAQAVRHLAYNAGRIVSYSLLGAFFGLMGSVFLVTPGLHGGLLIAAGVLMVVTALGMAGFSRMLQTLEHSFSAFPLFKRLFGRLIKSRTIGSFVGLGLLNGLFPCGFVFFFAAKAAASASMFSGALIMAVFGLATVPVLGLLGMSVGFFRGFAFRQMMNRLAAVAILCYGVLTVYYGLAYFFELPV